MLNDTNNMVASETRLTDGDFNRLTSLVYEHTGIKLSPLKKQLVYRRFSPRLKALNLTSFDQYCDVIDAGDSHELELFSNAITTNLTSFFREKHHFDFLEAELLPQLIKQNARTKKIRIWSAGCSTGQEPYSLAMVLNELMGKLRGWDVVILATDIDTECVNTAQSGLYPAAVADKVPAKFKDKYIEPAQLKGREAVKVSGRLKQLIRFRKLNLLKPFPFKGNFDAIFCRNVLIYFDKPTQATLAEKFAAHQKVDSHLFLGHSENICGLSNQYQLLGHTIYQRTA